MRQIYLVEPGFYEPTVIYKVTLKQVAKIDRATAEEVTAKLDDLGAWELVVDAGNASFIDQIKTKFLVHKILRRKGGA